MYSEKKGKDGEEGEGVSANSFRVSETHQGPSEEPAKTEGKRENAEDKEFIE